MPSSSTVMSNNAGRHVCCQALYMMAFLFFLAPSVLKPYETSHWFRSTKDPSDYDLARDWFEVASIPYSRVFNHHDKTLLRVYFFVVPYILSALSLGAALILKGSPSRSSTDLVPRSRFYLVLRSSLGRNWVVPQVLQDFAWLPSNVSTAELLATLVYLILNLGTLVVRVKRSYPRGTRKLTFLVDLDEDLGKETITHFSWEGCEIWAKTLGILAIMNLSWYLILPIGRRSVMLEALSLSWERAVKYHRWIGYYTTVLVFLHGAMYIGVWIYGNSNSRFDPNGTMIRRNLVPWGCREVGFCDDDEHLQLRINYYGIGAMVCMIIMAFFTLPWIRRMHFEWFYYSHHLFVLVLILLCLHYSGSFIYLIPGVAMYMVDKLYPLYAYGSAGTVKTRLAAPDILEISVPTMSQDYYGGAYIFLNVPSVSWLEWHPYSLTSAPGNGGQHMVFHLKGAGAWTNAVIDAARQAKASGSDLTVRIDGMYGHDVKTNLVDKDAVVLVGGGIGVTPMLSIATDLAHSAPQLPITLLWTVRTITEFGVLAKHLAELQERSSNIEVRTWVTLSQQEPTTDGKSMARAVDKADLSILEGSQQARVLANCVIHDDEEDEVEFSPSYVFKDRGLRPAANAFVNAISIIVGLSAYALVWNLGRVNEVQPQDKLSAIQMGVLVLSVTAVVVIIQLLGGSTQRSTTFPTMKTNDHSASVTEDSATSAANESASEILVDSVVTPEAQEICFKKVTSWSSEVLSDEVNDTEPASIGSSPTIERMVMGRISCRPDLASELGNIVTRGMHQHKNVGVLACGPVAMIKAVTQSCNHVSKNSDGSDLYYSFTEEDWEW